MKALLARATGPFKKAHARGRTGFHGTCPQRAPGVELVGEYKDSGFNDPPYIVRRADGQIVQLSRLLYLVLAEADGRQNIARVARAVSRQFGRGLSPDNVAFLIESKLQPAGLIGAAEAPTAQPTRVDPLLALRHRAALVPARAIRAASRVLTPLFFPAVMGAALSWLVALDVWVFVDHGIGAGVRAVLQQPMWLLCLLGLVVVSAVWHELGHATACAYGGATPGRMGIGLYVVWPAFYTDVTDAYRLGRGGRLRTDLGGVYFNGLFALAAGGGYVATRFEPLLVLVAVQHFQILQQLTPLMRLDGYYVVTDLVGVPDVLSRIRPILLSLLPFRPVDPRVAELKPWVRGVASAYVVGFLAALGAIFALLALHAPDFVPTAETAFNARWQLASVAWQAGMWPEFAVAAVQLGALLLPALGMTLGLLRLARVLAGPRVARMAPAPRLRVGIAFAAGVAAASAVFAWEPGQGFTAPGGQASPAASVVQAKNRHTARRLQRMRRRAALRRAARRRRARASQRSPSTTPPPAPSQTTPAPGSGGAATTSPDTSAGSSDGSSGGQQPQAPASGGETTTPTTTTPSASTGGAATTPTAPAP